MKVFICGTGHTQAVRGYKDRTTASALHDLCRRCAEVVGAIKLQPGQGWPGTVWHQKLDAFEENTMGLLSGAAEEEG